MSSENDKSTSNVARSLVRDALARIRKVNACQVDSNNLVIWGGKFLDNRLPAFLDLWGELLKEELPWRMYEYISYFTVQQGSSTDFALPTSSFNLERARFFGQLGDLDIRRDENHFRWRFIGDKSERSPQLLSAFKVNNFKVDDFWTKYSSNPPVFREVIEQYYQWRGTRDEQRVGKKWLKQAKLPDEKVYLIQKHYLLNGQVAFVRYMGFTTEGESDGKTKGKN